MISANSALQSIDAASRSIRDDESRIGQVIESTSLDITQLRTEQSELFRALARIRLDALAQNQILGTLDAAEQRAYDALEKQRLATADLSAKQDAAAEAVRGALAAREELATDVSEDAAAIEARQSMTEARMADDLAWQAQSARVAGIEGQARAADEKAASSEEDRELKSKPYLADRLFVYLWERGYGTTAYRAGPFTRMGDAFVARIVRYEEARRNYYALTEIPKRLRQHALGLQQDLEDQANALRVIERKALEADGIAELEQRHESAVAALDKADAEIARLQEAVSQINDTRKALLEDRNDTGLGKALSDLAASMQRDDLRVLMREAMETPTPDDEKIVARLQDAEARLLQLSDKLDEARSTALELARRRTEIERSRDEFRRSGYEQRGGTFSNDKLLGDILGGIIGGVLSSRELRDALRSGYRGGGSNQSRGSDSIFGGSSGPFGGGNGGISGSRSGGRKSSGGKSSGGFRTGGGF